MLLPPSIQHRRHLVTFSWDDGLRASCLTIAGIHELHGLPACLNVTAANDGTFGGDAGDSQLKFPRGDFTLWKQLAAHGHEIQPHGWNHTKKSAIPLEAAQNLCRKTWLRFAHELPGFRREASVFNFPYNASTPALDEWVQAQVRAIRVPPRDGDHINPLPSRATKRIVVTGSGTDPQADTDARIDDLLTRDSGWLIVNLHGCTPEGWMPVTPAWLDRTLAQLKTIPTLAMIPAAMALAQADELGW